MSLRTLFCVLAFSPVLLSGQFMLSPGVSASLENGGGSPGDTTELADMAGKLDFLFLPENTLNKNGDPCQNGDDIYQWNDLKNYYTLEDECSRPRTTPHMDTTARYTDSSNLSPLKYARLGNVTDNQWFDNSISSGDLPPFEFYYLLRPLQTALNERFFNGAFVVEDNNNSYLSVRYNNGSEVNFLSSGGDWIMPWNKNCAIHGMVKASGWFILEIDTGTGWQRYGDSAYMGNIASVKPNTMQIGSNNRINAHWMYAFGGTVNRLLTPAEREYMDGIIDDEIDPGSYPIGGRVDNASWTFNSTTNVFTMTWDHTSESGGTIDSVRIYVHWHDETLGAPIWIDALFKKITVVEPSSAFGDGASGSYSFDRDDYEDLSPGTGQERIKAYMQVYDSNLGWSDLYESTFIINNV